MRRTLVGLLASGLLLSVPAHAQRSASAGGSPPSTTMMAARLATLR